MKRKIDTPIREQVRLDNRWHARPLDQQSASVFVPAPWAEKQVALKTGDGRQAHPQLEYGTWNAVATGDEPVNGARLVAGDALHISSLEASVASERSLSVRVRLSEPGAVNLFFSLTRANGKQVGWAEVTVGRKTGDLTVEVPLAEPLTGPHRLKASLSVNDHVIDNARIEVNV